MANFTLIKLIRGIFNKASFEVDYSHIEGLTYKQKQAINTANKKAFKEYKRAFIPRIIKAVDYFNQKAYQKLDLSAISLADVDELNKRGSLKIRSEVISNMIVRRLNESYINPAEGIEEIEEEVTRKYNYVLRLNKQLGYTYWQFMCKTLEDLLLAGYDIPVGDIGYLQINMCKSWGGLTFVKNEKGEDVLYFPRLSFRTKLAFKKSMYKVYNCIYGDREDE